MTSLDFHALLDALAPLCPVQASELIADTHDVELDDTVISLQWDEAAQGVALTIAVPLLMDEPASEATQLLLFRALLERHWAEMGGEDGIGFGLLPEVGAVVGTAWLPLHHLSSPEALLAGLQQAVAAVLEAWYGVCALIVQAQAAQHASTAPDEERASLGMHLHG